MLSLACSRPHPEIGVTLPEPPAPRPRPSAERWHIPEWGGSVNYHFARHAVVSSDSPAEKPLVLDSAGVENFTRHAAPGADTISVTGSAADHSAPISVLIVGDRLLLENQSPSSDECKPARNQLHADLTDVATTFPGTLLPVTTWADSVSVELCVGGIPGRASVIRHFAVVGDTLVGAEPAITIARRDSATIDAEGIVAQHATAVHGGGQGNVLIYVSQTSGRVLRVAKDQLLRLSVTAEGSTRTFVQRLTSVLELER